jgi:hypothetical protein
MPILSIELLAVIGGLYLRQAHLDDVRQDDSKGPMRFLEMAESLVKELAPRSGAPGDRCSSWGGENWLCEAEIIRLRFPACDIWHLPFTAHEYGYLVAKNRPPDLFKNLLAEVRSKVDPPSTRAAASPDHLCFSKEIQDLWDRYYNLRPSEQEDFSKDHDQELNTLANRQEVQLSRLFADAFATFFVGPAYVHALLHLRFIPDGTLDQPSAAVPPFTHRFVFALETLKWMNNEPIVDPGMSERRRPFAREVDDTTGILLLWRQTLESADKTDTYKQVADSYEPWLTQTREALKTDFGTNSAIGKTYENWRTARGITGGPGPKDKPGLEERLLDPSMTVDERPSMWAVLNAAWSARWEHSESLDTIQANALRVLDPDDKEVIKPVDRALGGAPRPKEEDTTDEKALRLVQEALATTPDAYMQFIEMVKDPRGLRMEAKILEALAKRPDAYKVYMAMCKQSSP